MRPKPELCVGAVVVDRGRLLLVQRAKAPGVGQWSLPGGRVESGELMAEAVVREIAEETGLVVEVGELIGWVERISATHHFAIFDFAAVAVGERDLVAGDDAAEARWVPLAAVHELDLVAGLIEFLDQHQVTPLRS